MDQNNEILVEKLLLTNAHDFNRDRKFNLKERIENDINNQ